MLKFVENNKHLSTLEQAWLTDSRFSRSVAPAHNRHPFKNISMDNPSPSAPLRHKLTIAYHGASFKGWQRQPDNTTVQGEIERALANLFCQPVEIFGSGRTDQGVHAVGQVAHVDIPKPMEPYPLMAGLNHFLRPHIAIQAVEPIHSTFHARFDAIQRTYHYQIYTNNAPCPLMADRAWHINQPLCISSMREAAQILLGPHDFSYFRSHDCQSQSPMRTLNSLELLDDNQTWRISARSFLHHQVRFIMGALAHVGLGKQNIDWLRTLLKPHHFPPINKPFKAPAHGLCLMDIQYPEPS